MTTTTFWACIGIPPRTPSCGAVGTFEQHDSGGAADKHTKDTGHSTIAGISPERIERVAAMLTAGQRALPPPERCWLVNYRGTDLHLNWEEYRALYVASYAHPEEAERLADQFLTRSREAASP